MRKVLGDRHPYALTSLCHQANILIDMKSHNEAEHLLVPLLQACVEVHGPEHPETMSVAYALALTHLHQGRTESATQMLRDVHKARTRVLGPDHPDTKLTSDFQVD
jgi:hypothetical protein